MTDSLAEISVKNKSADLSRIAHVLKRAANGEDITIGFIGGSITEGAKATDRNEKTYSAVVRRWWEQTFPNSTVRYINAGIGATNSYFGVHRADLELLDYEPDFVIVEFSVNDSDSDFFTETYEGLVRKILSKKNEPAVFLLNMTKADFSYAESAHLAVSNQYNLPTLSFHDVLAALIESGEYAWSDFEADTVHPNDAGHALCGEIIWRYLNSCAEQCAEYSAISYSIPESITKNRYEHGYILTPQNLSSDCVKLSDSWAVEDASLPHYSTVWKTTDASGEFLFEGVFQNLGIVYYQKTSSEMGIIDVYIDDELVKSVNTKGSYNDPISVSIFNSEQAQKHTVRIKEREETAEKIILLQGLLLS